MERQASVRISVFTLLVAMMCLIVAILACGGAAEPETAPPAPTSAPAPAPATTTPPTAVPAAQAAQPESAPAPSSASWTDGHPRASTKKGGTARAMVPAGLAHHDLHQSITFNNMGPQISMYNGLLYFDPDEDGVFSVGADLARSWELSDDGKSYTFHLNEGVLFHDGSTFTAGDVVATFDKILNPKEGVLSLRKIAFEKVDSVDEIDDTTVRFTLSQPDAILPKSIAIGFNVIVSKDTLEANDYDLRAVFDAPGTGPFKYSSHRDKEVWNLEKNVDYFKDGLPYLDNLKLFHGTGAPAAAALLAGQIEYAAWIVKDDGAKIAQGDFPGLKTRTWGVYNNTAIWFNVQRPPWNDSRVRRAVFLVIDPHVMLELWRATRLGEFGEWIPPASLGGQYSRSEDELANTPGWRTPTAEDIAEAKKLMADAGYGEGFNVDFLARGSVTSQTEGIAQILKEHFNVQSNFSVSDAGVYYDKVWQGDWDVTRATWTNMFDDPCEIWRNVLRSDSPQNYANYQNDDLDAAVTEVCSTIDPVERAAAIAKARDILDQEVPVLVIDWPIGQNAWNDEKFELNPAAWTTNYWNHRIWEISALK
jgi:peptide/nickel transport system substrate-binding protein